MPSDLHLQNLSARSSSSMRSASVTTAAARGRRRRSTSPSPPQVGARTTPATAARRSPLRHTPRFRTVAMDDPSRPEEGPLLVRGLPRGLRPRSRRWCRSSACGRSDSRSRGHPGRGRAGRTAGPQVVHIPVLDEETVAYGRGGHPARHPQVHRHRRLLPPGSVPALDKRRIKCSPRPPFDAIVLITGAGRPSLSAAPGRVE